MKLFATEEEARAYCEQKSINDACREFGTENCRGIE